MQLPPPPLTVGALNIGNLTIPSGGNLQIDLNSNTVFDSLNVTGSVNVTGSNLELFVNGPLTNGNTYTLVSNDGTDPVIGQFAGGTTIPAVNNIRYNFSINYAGGDGNDIVATAIVNPNSVLDVTNGVVTYQAIQGTNNALTVGQSAGNYTFADPSTLISLTSNAMAAGWTGDGTNTVTGPMAGVTGLILNLSDGADGIAGVNAGSASVSIIGTGTLNVSGLIATSSTLSISGITDLSMSGTGLLQGTTVTLTTSNSIGTSTQPIATQATAIVASTGAGSMYITEADGANVTASATGAGNVVIVNTMGTLNVAGAITTATGNISLSSGDDITLNANVNAGSGTITLAANTDGAGSNSLTQNATAATSTITTTNNSANAINIQVNVSGAGTGNASLRSVSATAGTLTVQTFGGSILYAGTDTLDVQQSSGSTVFTGIVGPAGSSSGLGGSGSAPSGTVNAKTYVLSTDPTGAGSIGTATRPINTTSPSGNAEMLTAGSGGVYFIDWGNPLTLNGATAAGAGNVVVVAANAGGHVLTVAGNVSTGSGNVFLAADDDFDLNSGVTVGGAGFSGTVYLAANRDNGNNVVMNVLGNVVTSNASSSAVVIEGHHSVNNGTNAGAVIVNNVNTGDGGTITVSTVPVLVPTGQGTILAASNSSVLNAGPTGTVKFIATTMFGNATYTSAVGTSAMPMQVTAGNVIVTAISGKSGSSTGPADSVYVTDTIAGNFTATNGSNSPGGSINLATSAGTLTVINPLDNPTGGAINLNGAGGVVLNATVGSSAAGAISITGGLSGSGNIVTGTGSVTVTQSTNSTYSGVISGGNGLTTSGNGTLTLMGVNTYTGTTAVNGGGLCVNGSLATSGTTVANGAVLTGAGTVTAVSLGGQISAGTVGTPGMLFTGNLSFTQGGAVVADLVNAAAGPGVGYDQLNVTGTVDLTNAPALQLIVPSTGVNVGDSFTLIANDGVDAVLNQFAGGTTIQAFNNPLYFFTINYAGGDGNDVVATLSSIATSGILDVTNGVVTYSSGPGVNNNVNVDMDINQLNYIVSDTANAVILTANAINAGWTVNAGAATGPISGVSSFVFNLNDGADAFSLLNVGIANVTATTTGSLALNGAVTTTGSFTVSQMSNISGTGAIVAGSVAIVGANNSPLAFGALNVADGDVTVTENNTVTFTDVVSAPSSNFTLIGAASIVAGANGQIAATTLNLSAANGIGTNTQSLGTQATAIVANGGSGGVYITEADGADLTATATGAGNISIMNTTGTLNVAGTTSTANGTLSLISGGALSVSAPTSTVGNTLTLNSGSTLTIGAPTSSMSGALMLISGVGAQINSALSTTSGNITIDNTSTALSTTAAVTTTTGNIYFSSGDSINLSANVNAGSGTITLIANTDGLGADSVLQDPTLSTLTTTNTSVGAVNIQVNTSAGGTGSATLRSIAAVSGTLTVQTFGGSIVYSGTDTLTTNQAALTALAPGINGPSSGGSASAGTINALKYVLSCNGSGSIGSAARPIQAVTPASNTELFTAGSGGIYFIDFGNPMTLNGATATGAGNVIVVAGNANGHNLTVAGNVSTGSGNIVLAADDDFTVDSSATIGGPGFSGDVYLACNRDTGNGANLTVSGSIVSSNTTSSAVVIEGFHAVNDGTNSGVVAVNNITVGDGGTITVSTVPASLSTGQGSIVPVNAASVLNAGPTGTVNFIATTMFGNATYMTSVGTPTMPMLVTAGNVVVTATSGMSGTSAGPADSVYVTDTIAGNFTVTTGSASPSGSINLATSSGILTIAGATHAGGGSPIVLTGAGGIAINAPLGSSDTGTITLNAGAANMAILNSTLTLNDNQSLAVTASGGLTIGATGVLGGTGASTNNFAVNTMPGGTVSPGSNLGILSTGNLNLAGGTLAVDLDGPSAGTGYDQVNVTGTVNVTGATLNPTLLTVGFNPTIGTVFTIIKNDGTDAVTGQFAGLSEGSLINIATKFFQISYVGGDGNDVTLTLVPPPTFYVDDNWTGFTIGQAIADADPVASGNEAALFGTNAFSSINAAIAACPTNGVVIVNAGNYSEDVVVNNTITLTFQQGAIAVNSIADTVNTATILLNGITLTTGADNASTMLSSPIGGTGALNKTGAGTLTLAGTNTYSGATGVTGGTLTIPAGASLTVSVCTVSSSGAFIVNGTAPAVQVAASSATSPAFGGSLLRGTGTTGAVTFNDAANVNAVIWPGVADLLPALTALEYLTPLTAPSVNFSNGGKLAVLLTNNNGVPLWQQLVVTNACTIPTTNAAFSFATDAATFGVPSSSNSYLVLNNPAKTIATTFPTVIAPAGAVLGVNFDLMYVDSANPGANFAMQSAIGGGKGLINTFATSFTADQVYVVFSGNPTGVTPVKLDSFTADAEGSGALLTWHSVSEFQNAGYQVYRRETGIETWTPVNATLIAGRLTDPSEHTYRLYDWAPQGCFEYRLESISMTGVREDYASLAGPVTVDAGAPMLATMSDDGIDAASAAIEALANVERVQEIGAQFAALNAGDPIQNALPKATAREWNPNAPGDFVPITPRAITPVPAVSAFSPGVSARWFSSNTSGASSFTAVKVVYSQSGVLAIPQATLPAGFDINHISITREGQAMTALAIKNNTLYLYVPGYSDDYTDNDALFLRTINGNTAAGAVSTASGLFAITQTPAANTPASVTANYHDVYFDYSTNFRPYTYAPWFSSQYLTDGSGQSFTLATPFAGGSAASLTVNLWSLTTDPNGASPDHALQVLVNGQLAGQTQWTGGNKMMQLSLAIPAGALNASAPNTIELVTPTISNVTGQIALLHSLQINYTRALDGSQPITIGNTNANQLYEVVNLPSAGAWVVDLRYTDRVTLVPCEVQAQPDGTYHLRFVANAGGTGNYLVVPTGQENASLSLSKRTVKPLTAVTYLAVGPSQFASGVQALLLKHSKEGLRGTFVDQEQLFDYYNYGRYGPDGIRNAVRATLPSYLLLAGRTTYDYHNYSGANVDPLCPAYLVSTSFWAQTTSDSLFGDLGNGYPEVAVGRLPVNNTTELTGAVQHVLAYNGAPDSGITVQSVADLADPAAGDFPAQSASMAQSFPDMTWQANYYSVTTQTLPEVTAEMTTAANGGADWIVYNGHGNAAHLGQAGETILDTTSVQAWTGNVVFLQSTCTGNWMANDVPDYKSVAIQALTQPQGGISASIGTSTYMNSTYAVAFMMQLMKNADASGMRWGDALVKAQQWAYKQGGGYNLDLSNTEQLFGDPAMPVFAKTPPPPPAPTKTAPVTGTF